MYLNASYLEMCPPKAIIRCGHIEHGCTVEEFTQEFHTLDKKFNSLLVFKLVM